MNESQLNDIIINNQATLSINKFIEEGFSLKKAYPGLWRNVNKTFGDMLKKYKVNENENEKKRLIEAKEEGKNQESGTSDVENQDDIDQYFNLDAQVEDIMELLVSDDPQLQASIDSALVDHFREGSSTTLASITREVIQELDNHSDDSSHDSDEEIFPSHITRITSSILSKVAEVDPQELESEFADLQSECITQ